MESHSINTQAKERLAGAFSDLKTYQDFIQLYMVLAQPNLQLKDTGISSRVLSHWKTQNLLPTKITGTTGGWNKFDFVDFIWLKIIQELREFGLPLKTIKKIKDTLFEKLDYKWNLETLDEAILVVKKLIGKLNISKEDKENAIQLMSQPSVYETLKKEDIIPSILDSLVLYTILFRQEAGIFIYSNSEIEVWFEKDNDVEKEEEFFPDSYLFISITKFFVEFLTDSTKEKFITEYTFLSEEEKEVLNRMRQNDLKEIIIKFPKNSGKQNIDIITKKNIGLAKEQQEEICRILSLKNYQSITLQNQGDGKLYIEKSHRTKLK